MASWKDNREWRGRANKCDGDAVKCIVLCVLDSECSRSVLANAIFKLIIVMIVNSRSFEWATRLNGPVVLVGDTLRYIYPLFEIRNAVFFSFQRF